MNEFNDEVREFFIKEIIEVKHNIMISLLNINRFSFDYGKYVGINYKEMTGDFQRRSINQWYIELFWSLCIIVDDIGEICFENHINKKELNHE